MLTLTPSVTPPLAVTAPNPRWIHPSIRVTSLKMSRIVTFKTVRVRVRVRIIYEIEDAPDCDLQDQGRSPC